MKTMYQEISKINKDFGTIKPTTIKDINAYSDRIKKHNGYCLFIIASEFVIKKLKLTYQNPFR